MSFLNTMNLPLLSIPAYTFLAYYPHLHAVLVSTQGNLNRHDNANPHSEKNRESLKRRLGQREYGIYERAKRCHQNHLENMPLFVAAVFAGLLADMKTNGANNAGVNDFVVAWMISRVLYTIAYIKTETQSWSYLRSTMYFVGTTWAFVTIGRAASVIGN